MFILASASPRRQEILMDEGFTFDVMPADIDESRLPEEAAVAMAERLAVSKAQRIADEHPKQVILAADTVVVLGETILGKPRDLQEAGEMIKLLSGKTHQVITGVAVRRAEPDFGEAWIVTTDVTFKTLTDAQIADYLKISTPLDKAGAYAIQEHEELLVESYEGLFSNVVGLPIETIAGKLRTLLQD